MIRRVTVIGAGVGGLAAALLLASKGLSVTVLEAGGRPGGKAAEVEVDGVCFDTGPSVLTLPGVLHGLLEASGVDLHDVVTLRPLDPVFRYRWPDGTVLDVMQEVEATEASVRAALGPKAASEFRAFMAYSKRIWEAAAPHFVLSGAPTVGRVAGLGFTGVRAIQRIDAFRTMAAAIRAQVSTPHLRDLFARFATYNGSDVRQAPATLNCIAHVEMGIGVFGVQGGMHRLPEGLAGAATRLGADVRCGARVESIDVKGGRVRGVRVAGGEQVEADAVVVNADVAHLVTDLLGSFSNSTLEGSFDRLGVMLGVFGIMGGAYFHSHNRRIIKLFQFLGRASGP